MRSPVSSVFSWTLALLAVVLLWPDARPALAHPAGPNVPYTVNVQDEWGNALRTFHKDGQTFVLGSYGQRYNIRVRNQTGVRVEAVVTVDGRDVVSGHVGDFTGERGYLIDAYGTLDIEGFRRSLDEVAAFRFTSPGDSYSSRMGTPENVGVIGVAFFPERPRPRPQRRVLPVRPVPVPQRYYYDEDASRAQPSAAAPAKSEAKGSGSMERHASAPASAPAAEGGGMPAGDSYASADKRARDSASPAENEPSDDGSAASTNNLGTQYGESHSSHVEEVSFHRANPTQPAQLIALRYDDEAGLQARGIQLYSPPVVSRREPNPFPYNQFAPPPP